MSYLVFMFKMVMLMFSRYLQGIILIGPILQHKLCHVQGKYVLSHMGQFFFGVLSAN